MNINRSKPPPPPTLKKPMISFRSKTQPQSSLPIKKGLTPLSLKLSTPISPIPKPNKPINSSIASNSLSNSKVKTDTANNKSVPPVPPRKSSIPRPAMIPQPPQRNSSTNLILRKPHVSHL